MDKTTIESNLRPKPSQVNIAVILLYASLAVAFIILMLDFGSVPFEVFYVSLLLMVFTFAILIFFITKISAGKNWARISFLIVVLIGITFYTPFIFQLFTTNVITAILTTVQNLMQLIAMIFLYQKPSNTWYVPRKTKRQRKKRIVETTSVENNSPTKPTQVKIAINLLYASLVVGVVIAVLGFTNLELGLIFIQLFTLGIVFGALIFFIIMISAGKNWARILFLIMLLLGILPFIFVVINDLETTTSVFVPILRIVQTMMQVGAMVFLFQEPSNAWYKSQRAK
jgi:hypothetical protein